MYEVPLTIEELGEKVCDYCHWFDYGESASSSHPDYGCVMCEGSKCLDAYEVYLRDHCECSELEMECCSKVIFENKEEFIDGK